MILGEDALYDRLWNLASLTEAPADLAGLDQEATHRILALARIHGVLGIILARLGSKPPEHPQTWDIAQRAWKGALVQSLRVRHHAQELLGRFKQAGIPAVIIKGPDFADHLYPQPRLRPTLDVDLLVPRNRWHEAARVLEAMGHRDKVGQPGPFLPTGVLSERTWVSGLPSNAIEVDLHWSLVHFPYFRRQASVEYWNLDWHWEAQGTGQLTPASRLIIAAVHALYHHQFERLLHLVDIQHACRQIQGPAHHQALRALMERTGTGLALDVSLQVTARLLEDPVAENLRQALGQGGAILPAIPQGLMEDARRTLRTIRTHYMTPGRRRIREWLMRRPMRPEPGWEFRPPQSPRPTAPPQVPLPWNTVPGWAVPP